MKVLYADAVYIKSISYMVQVNIEAAAYFYGFIFENDAREVAKCQGIALWKLKKFKTKI